MHSQLVSGFTTHISEKKTRCTVYSCWSGTRMTRRVTAIACAAAVLVPTAVFAQQDPGAVTFAVQFFLGAEDSSSPPGWRIYAEPRELRFRISLSNDSNTPIRIDQRLLRDAFVFRVTHERRPDMVEDVPVRVDWLERGPDASVQLEPRALAMWTIVVSRADAQPFSAGLYQIQRGFENMRAAVRTTDGAAWSGRVPDGMGQWAIRVQPAESAAERAIPDLLMAADASRLGEFETALDFYRRAAAEDPVNSTATLGLADTYLHLARYREALSVLEGVAGRPGWSLEAIGGALTQAYVGVGDVATAVKVLQSIGLTQEEIAEAIKDMRQYVAENPPK